MKFFSRLSPDNFKFADETELEADKLARIRSLCRFAAGSAECIAISRSDDDFTRYHEAKYKRAKTQALEIALTMTNTQQRDNAVYSIIVLCLKAADFAVPKALVDALQTDAVRKMVLNEISSLDAHC